MHCKCWACACLICALLFQCFDYRESGGTAQTLCQSNFNEIKTVPYRNRILIALHLMARPYSAAGSPAGKCVRGVVFRRHLDRRRGETPGLWNTGKCNSFPWEFDEKMYRSRDRRRHLLRRRICFYEWGTIPMNFLTTKSCARFHAFPGEADRPSR